MSNACPDQRSRSALGLKLDRDFEDDFELGLQLGVKLGLVLSAPEGDGQPVVLCGRGVVPPVDVSYGEERRRVGCRVEFSRKLSPLS